jgi:predicted DNA-binding transcriptional regulator AlpA
MRYWPKCYDRQTFKSISVPNICKILRLSRPTLYRYLARK